MSILSKGYKPVMEAYYGKPKEFLTVEKELDKLITIIKKENSTLLNSTNKAMQLSKPLTDLNKTDSIITIENIIKKFFGFKEFHLCIYYPIDDFITARYNAYTDPSSFNFFKRDKTTGKIDRSSICVGVNIDMLLILYGDLNADEVLAVILHEIGHNMDISIFMLLSNFPFDLSDILNKTPLPTLMGKALGSLLHDIFDIGRFKPQIISKVESILNEKFPILLRLTTFYHELILNFKSADKFQNIMSIIKNPMLSLPYLIKPSNIFGYANEKYADSFATAYGYGMATSTLRNKLQKSDNFVINKILTNIPIINYAYDLSNITFEILTMSSDPHPTDAVRISEQLNKLKRDQQDPNLSPRLKKSLQEEIDELQNFIDNYYLNFDKNDNNKRIFTWMFNYLVIKVFKNKIDFRETFETISRHEE